jgi:hypothetical protein
MPAITTYRMLVAVLTNRLIGVEQDDDEGATTAEIIVWTGISILAAIAIAAIVWNKLKTGANDIQVPAPAAP